jgi:O-antigen/teichoic acid export membrane protein
MRNNKAIGKKQISINMVANVVSYSSNLIISFILTPFLIDTLGKDVYSFYPIANSIVSYLSVLTATLNTMASRFFTVEIVNGNDKEANKYFSSVLASNIVISFFMFIPMAVIVVFVDTFLNVPINSVAAIRTLFALVFSAALVNVVGSIFGIATFAKNRIDLRSARELVTAVIRLGLYVLLYSILPPSIVYVGLVTLVVVIISLSIQVFYTKKLLPGIRFKKADVSFTHVKKLLSSTVWSIIFTFGNILLSGLTIVLINILYSADDSGSLSIVQTVPTFINGVISMLVGVFFPVITYKVAEKDIDGAVKQILSAQRIIAIVGCAVIAVFSGLAKEFFTLWTPEENAAELSKLSFVAIMPHLVISCMWILSNLNIAMNKVRKPAIFTLFIGSLNILFALIVSQVLHTSYVYIQIISSALQIIWAGLFLPIYASRELKVSISTFYPPLIRAIIATVLCFLLTILSKPLFTFDNWLVFIVFGGFVGIISLLIFAVFEFGPKGLIKTIKNFKLKNDTAV